MEGNGGMTCQGSRRKGAEWSAAPKSTAESSKMKTGEVHWISQLGCQWNDGTRRGLKN